MYFHMSQPDSSTVLNFATREIYMHLNSRGTHGLPTPPAPRLRDVLICACLIDFRLSPQTECAEMTREQNLQNRRAPASSPCPSWNPWERPIPCGQPGPRGGWPPAACPKIHVAGSFPFIFVRSLPVLTQLTNSKIDQAMCPTAIKC